MRSFIQPMGIDSDATRHPIAGGLPWRTGETESLRGSVKGWYPTHCCLKDKQRSIHLRLVRTSRRTKYCEENSTDRIVKVFLINIFLLLNLFHFFVREFVSVARVVMSGSGKSLLGVWLYRRGKNWAVKEGSPLHKPCDVCYISSTVKRTR